MVLSTGLLVVDLSCMYCFDICLESPRINVGSSQREALATTTNRMVVVVSYQISTSTMAEAALLSFIGGAAAAGLRNENKYNTPTFSSCVFALSSRSSFSLR